MARTVEQVCFPIDAVGLFQILSRKKTLDSKHSIKYVVNVERSLGSSGNSGHSVFLSSGTLL